MNLSWKKLLVTSGLALFALTLGLQVASARQEQSHQAQASTIHPTFAMLDARGGNVLTSGAAVSTIQTCGQCHDTDFISSHSFHSDLGLADYAAGSAASASPGLFGHWDPLAYRYLSQSGDERLDLGTPEWLMLNADRLVGGGPAARSRDGHPLAGLAPSRSNAETSILSDNGQPQAWDWRASGTLEMNCFLCHLEAPDNAARIASIRSGDFAGASTATLQGSGLVVSTAGGWVWNPDAFDLNGELNPDALKIQDPTNANCAQCHGLVHTESQTPLVYSGCDLENSQTATTGQVIASQKISDSGMNIAGKTGLEFPFDIHAERQLKCTDCHFSLNNPVYEQLPAASPSTLEYDPRRLELSEYLEKPDHNLARGQSSQYNVAPELKGTMRRCESCHDAQQAHAGWLPYVARHMSAVACESCHIPRTYAPAIQSYDWTVLTPDGQPRKVCRGVEGSPDQITSLVTGYQPALLTRANTDGGTLVAPYNLITSFYWAYDDPNGARPVRLVDLESAYFQNGAYRREIIAAFDGSGDGRLDQRELVIDSAAKAEAVAGQLSALGLQSPRIQGLVQPYSLNHDVVEGEYAVNDCRSCHDEDSRLTQSIKLSDYSPAGVTPVFAAETNVNATGAIVRDAGGALYYQPRTAGDGLYVFGSSRVAWIDRLGALLFAGTVLGAGGHGTLRILVSRRHPKGRKRTSRIYMYQSYERFWHWLQTIGIVILLLTGLVIHRPDLFGVFSFRHMVAIHNVIAAILAINAALSLFYHLATGQIRQFLPRPYGFFDDAIVQAKYYLRGIFQGDGHPFAKSPDRKLNPLQQATYFGLLNVLLPLQGLTGLLMWGAQKWPQLAGLLGGLPLLAPLHSLVAWTLAAFIVGHVYLTTTGATPLEAMRAMIGGWEQVELHGGHEIGKPGHKGINRPLRGESD